MTPPAYRVLAVAAHPDDIEFSCGGTLAAWADEGAEVTLCIVTDGSTGTQDRDAIGASLAGVRRRESEKAGAVLGASEVVWLDYPDGYVVYSLELRRDIARVFRRFRPHRFVVMDPTVTIEDRFINHPDHRAVGHASLDVVMTAGTTPGHFPELLGEGFAPWRGLREVWIAGAGSMPVAVDISTTVDRKIDALLCHTSQVGDGERAAEWVRRWTAEAGLAYGYEHAETFRVIRQGPGFHVDEQTEEVPFEPPAPPPDPRSHRL